MVFNKITTPAEDVIDRAIRTTDEFASTSSFSAKAPQTRNLQESLWRPPKPECIKIIFDAAVNTMENLGAMDGRLSGY